ncbi:hypothetical protein CSA37_12115 [Candidatus Fermentibacteria bacterium]|nr:MAG: hypothetical protein CSA37_12115 [Candidatus Fermentibacteria bacterium]
MNWSDKKSGFEVIDVRKAVGNFLPGFLRKAASINSGEGICVVQSFEPVPLYSAMSDLGFQHETEKAGETEYRVYFYRTEVKEPEYAGGGDMPLKPTAILNFKSIDDKLADIVVNFWDLVWNGEEPAIDMKTRLLLSLANGVGAGRFRQATRELVKAWSAGVTVAELDELFTLLVWNGGIGTFASEIGPSPLFGAYRMIKSMDSAGKSRNDIMAELLEKFGNRNPEVKVNQ